VYATLQFVARKATLAQLVERLIRNFPLPPYIIHSKFGLVSFRRHIRRGGRLLNPILNPTIGVVPCTGPCLCPPPSLISAMGRTSPRLPELMIEMTAGRAGTQSQSGGVGSGAFGSWCRQAVPGGFLSGSELFCARGGNALDGSMTLRWIRDQRMGTGAGEHRLSRSLRRELLQGAVQPGATSRGDPRDRDDSRDPAFVPRFSPIHS